MIKLLYNLLRLVRPRQWIKNFAVFAAIIFSGELFNFLLLEKVILSFIVFCGLSSATYIINDIFDVESDRLHPFKKFRPLANKDVPMPIAQTFAIILMVSSLALAIYVTPAFFVLAVVYLLLQFFYSTFLKTITVLDILAIAAGYILRVYAGEFATGLHISVWLLLTTISFSLFIAIGKRRSELTLVSQRTGGNIAATRKTLSHYSERLLDVYASVFATGTFVSYSLFTFLEEPRHITLPEGFIFPEFLPTFFQKKWLMITIIPVVYILMRYLQDIYEKHEGESPDKVLLSDKPLLTAVILWGILVIFIIYFIGA